MDKYKDKGVLLMQSDLVKFCKEVISMGGETNITLFNSIYNDISEAFGIDVALHMYEHYKGLQVTFPTRLFNADYGRYVLHIPAACGVDFPRRRMAWV